eukprot:2625680-Pyramimonas_sp.AAC.1
MLGQSPERLFFPIVQRCCGRWGLGQSACQLARFTPLGISVMGPLPAESCGSRLVERKRAAKFFQD